MTGKTFCRDDTVQENDLLRTDPTYLYRVVAYSVLLLVRDGRTPDMAVVAGHEA